MTAEEKNKDAGNAEVKAAGPWVHGRSVVLFPEPVTPGDLKSAYLNYLGHLRYPCKDTPDPFSDDDGEPIAAIPTYFLANGDRSGLLQPQGDTSAGEVLSSILKQHALVFRPWGKAKIWTWFLYHEGHLIDRFASCPQWIPEGNWGDLSFDVYAKKHGSGQALREYRLTWKGDAARVAELFSITSVDAERYLRQFSSAELEDFSNFHKRYTDCKAFASDHYSLASPWVFIDLIERLGYPAFMETYWDPDSRPTSSWSIAPVYTPMVLRNMNDQRPPERTNDAFECFPCAQRPFPDGGFFRSHEEACQREMEEDEFP